MNIDIATARDVTRKLNTIQKHDNLNEVWAMDEKGSGNANHSYEVRWKDENGHECSRLINFQNGPRNLPDSIHGIIDSDLLEIVRDRLIGFQSGNYATRENAIALTHIEEALLWLNKRTEDRAEANVLGTLENG